MIALLGLLDPIEEPAVDHRQPVVVLRVDPVAHEADCTEECPRGRPALVVEDGGCNSCRICDTNPCSAKFDADTCGVDRKGIDAERARLERLTNALDELIPALTVWMHLVDGEIHLGPAMQVPMNHRIKFIDLRGPVEAEIEPLRARVLEVWPNAFGRG